MADYSSINQEFIRKLTEIILENLGNENFGVNELAQKAGVSHYTLSHRLGSVTGKTINQFIRETRLYKALEMLQKNEMTAAEVAYKTGFGSATYFNTCFSEFFGYPPGSLKKGEFKNVNEVRAIPDLAKKRQIRIISFATSGLIITATVIFLIWHIPSGISPENSSDRLGIQERSIAVLPFKNLSDSSGNEYFAYGITEDILNLLSKVQDIRVVPRSSVERFNESKYPTSEIAAKLKVTYIVDGSVQKSGNMFRLLIQLIDAKAGQQLWSEVYDGNYSIDLFDFQSMVAKKVASSMNAIIKPEEEKRINNIPTRQMLAYDLASRAYEMIRKWYYTRDSLDYKLSINLVNQALNIDPEYIFALQQKCTIFQHSGNHDSALYYADKILEIDPENAVAFQKKGGIYFYNRIKPDSALMYCLKADKLAPDDPWNNLCIGQIYCMQKNDLIKGLPYYNKSIIYGGGSEPEINQNIASAYLAIDYYSMAEKYMKNAIYAKPECVLVKLYGDILINQKKYNESFHFLDSISGITPCEHICDILRFRIYATLKEFEKAEKFYNLSVTAGHTTSFDDRLYLAYLYIETDRKKEALTILNNTITVIEENLNNTDSWGISLRNVRLAACYALLDERTKALKCLSEVERTGPNEYYMPIGIFPGFDKLRSDPEFQVIFKRIEDKKASLRAQVKEMERRGEIDL